jgi:hypothetical protein
MLAIRLAFFAVAALFALLGVQQAWHAVEALGGAGGLDTGGVIAALAALGCFVAAVGTVWVTLRLPKA